MTVFPLISSIIQEVFKYSKGEISEAYVIF